MITTFLMSDLGKRYGMFHLVLLVSGWLIIYASDFPYCRNLLASVLISQPIIFSYLS